MRSLLFAASSSTEGTTTVRQAPGSPANFAARTRRRPKASSRSVLARRAPRVTNMLVGSTTWLITPCAERSRCNQNPSRPASKQLTTNVDTSSEGFQPAAQASDESKQPRAVARFQTMNLSPVVRGQTIRDDPGGRAQFDSEIDDLMANIRQHASAPVPDVGFPSLAEAPATQHLKPDLDRRRLRQAFEMSTSHARGKFGRGRDAGFPAPPAQIRTCRATAYGSCLGS